MLDWICHQLRAVSLSLGQALQSSCVGELKHSINLSGNLLIHVFSLMCVCMPVHNLFTLTTLATRAILEFTNMGGGRER